MVVPVPTLPTDVVISPSQGRVRAVRTGPKTLAFQDPDMVLQRTQPDGKIITLRNLFINRETAINRLTYDFQRNRVVDSVGVSVAAKHIKLPLAGRVVQYGVLDAKWIPLDVDPRKYIPAANEEVLERITFVDRQGNLVIEYKSYGLGKKYDRSKGGGCFVDRAKKALGREPEDKVTTKELQRAVVQRQFVLKRLTPRK